MKLWKKKLKINMLTFREFIVNEGLIKTLDIKETVDKSDFFLRNLKIKYQISLKDNNTISLKIEDFNYIQLLKDVFDTIENYFINICGWFPTYMYLQHLSSNKHQFKYNEEYLLKNAEYFSKIEIIFESKFDIEHDLPEKLYHLSIKQFKPKILKSGLFPKGKSKISKHLDRIYVCDTLKGCENLIVNMRNHYNTIKFNNTYNKINDAWIIYEIDTIGLNLKLYKDPNYKGGFYIIDNIPANRIKIIKEE